MPNGDSSFVAPASAAAWAVYLSGLRMVPALSTIRSAKAKLNLFSRDVNSGDQSMPLLPPSTNNRTASDWSRDGRFLIYTETDPKTAGDIWYLPDPGKPGSSPVKFVATAAIESQGALSPDGQWLAYTSWQSDVREILIRSFPAGDRLIRTPGTFAREPRWSTDGKELFYLTQGKPRQSLMMSIPVQAAADGRLQLGAPRQIAEFETASIVIQNNILQYSPHPDGKRFLVNINASEAPPILNVITNWQQFARSTAGMNR
jgi:Tol biopolymer transport system component